MCTSSPKLPPVQDPPKTLQYDPNIEASQLRERKAQQASLGFRSTILTSPGGVLGPASTSQKLLVGP